jgi:site-specific DNA recombinase
MARWSPLFREPFDILAETTNAAALAEMGESVKSAKSEIWLGDLDSNQD